ncbi:cytoskeleton-associated protein 2-like [Molossus molossus]|uniref:Cytoskeleton associated protein 2 like n=2 Tax=Molossus molossus TaxID=27622 RepID=A0A7J8E1V0_MOLMO|nr:cytoskeleton-associated protein 2-like [Molossus molossus]KAF6429122.1 cytoskeleton associated protein 2 like [Molossus molossus]
MVRPGLSAAVEERQRKLQEYLAAKGKLKCQNSKPYLKAKNNCPNPPPSKSTIRPKKDVTNRVALPVKATRPISINRQPRPASILVSQKPKLEPPKLLGKRLPSGCVSSDPNCKPSSSHQPWHRAGSSSGELSRKTGGSLNIQELKAAKGTDQGKAAHTDSVDIVPGEGETLHSPVNEVNKENVSQTLLDSEKMPHTQLWTKNKPKNSSHNQTRGSLAPKQDLGKSLLSRAVLQDRANKQVGETRTRILPVKSQQLPRGAAPVQPGEKPPRTVPSTLVQTLSRTQASKKPGIKDMKDINVNRSKYLRPGGAKLQSHTVTEQKVEHARPRTNPSLLQGGPAHIKQDQKLTQPCSRPRTSSVQQKSKALSQRPNLAVGSFTSVIPNTPSMKAITAKANKHNSTCPQKTQTLDSKLKGALPQSHFLNKTAPKTQAGGTAVNRRGVLNGTQTNPDVRKKATAEDRRKQLEEWQKSKGKIYKRPPMELKTKRKIIEEMNISFWKSMEKEEEERKAQLDLSNKINSTLTECLQLIEGGVLSNEVFTILSSIPEAEKFAKFWICKAKFLASKGTFDVIGLYEEAIRNGATPIQELREVVLNILQDPNRTRDGIAPDPLVAETNIPSIEELARDVESARESCLSPKEKDQVPATPQVTKSEQDNHPGIKLQVAPIPRVSGMPEVQSMKLITPVRRSARIERAVSRYPEMLQDHDLVVASLNELLEVEDTECFVFRKNEALPVTLGFQILES